MSKLREDIRVAILGAAAGLFSISVFLMIARIVAYYAYLSWLNEERTYDRYHGVEDLSWIPVAVWHLILSISASLIAHRHLARRLRSPFLLWQVVSITSLLGWGLTVSLIIGLQCFMSGSLYPLERLSNFNDLPIVTHFIASVFACNVFYGSVMKACSRQYTLQSDEILACDSASVDHLLTTS